MKVICAWCHYIIQEDDRTGLPDSHGICEDCQGAYYPRGGTQKQQRELRIVAPAPTYLGLNLLSSREPEGTFSYWPKIDWPIAQNDW